MPDFSISMSPTSSDARPATPEDPPVLYVDESLRRRLEAEPLPEWVVTPRQLADLELLLEGGFAPLGGFLTEAEYRSVLERMRLPDGRLWTIPITLDLPEERARALGAGARLLLREPEGMPLAVLEIADLYRPDRREEARAVYGTVDPDHPGVRRLLESTPPVCVGGRLLGLRPPNHYDFRPLRLSPRELRRRFRALGWQRVLAFQTRNPMHRAHVELTFRAAREVEANLLLHPTVGPTRPGDIDHYTRVRCYERVLRRYPEATTMLALVPLAMRMAGPREAVHHALVRRNYGVSHFLIGRDHAAVSHDRAGRRYHEPYAAQELALALADEIGLTVVPMAEMVYVAERAQYVPRPEVRPGETVLTISGTELRRRLDEGLEIPEWFTYPEIVEELRRSCPPRHRRGFVVFFTGFSGAGKSTLAHALGEHLRVSGGRAVSILDGDLVRQHLSSELGFSRAHRDLNIRRIAFVSAEIARAGGIAVCAPIAPYAATRREAREMVESAGGGFVEIHVATPLEVCERRDRKGLYARARAGLLKGFTGIDDPYEMPERPELVLDTTALRPEEAVHRILLKLEALGYVR
jgi:sulfate adenylyltransferase